MTPRVWKVPDGDCPSGVTLKKSCFLRRGGMTPQLWLSTRIATLASTQSSVHAAAWPPSQECNGHGVKGPMSLPGTSAVLECLQQLGFMSSDLREHVSMCFGGTLMNIWWLPMQNWNFLSAFIYPFMHVINIYWATTILHYIENKNE